MDKSMIPIEDNLNDKRQESLLDPMNSKSIVDQITTRITNAIINGELLPGQRIPTETELCESMQVGRNSVREAIKALVAMGVLNIRRAEGTFVAEGFSDRMLDPMVYGLILEGSNSTAMIELRRLFEIGILKLAIEKSGEEDINRMQEALTELRKVTEKPSDKNEILEADINFHRALEAAIKNPLVDKISVVIERLSRPTRVRAVEQFMQKHELQDMLDMHEQILKVIMKRDETAVSEVIDEHFKYWKEELR